MAPRVIPTQKSRETQKPQSGNQAPSSPVSSSPTRTVKDVPVKKDSEPVAPVEPEVKAPAQAPNIEDAVIEDAVVEEVPEVVPAVVPEAVAEAEPESAAEPDAEPRRRRRAAPEDAASGAHSNGLTVAEIMANLSSNNPSEGSGRRRRRED